MPTTINRPDPLICAVFLIVAFVLAGFFQTFWLRSRFSVRLQVPIDGSRTIRGKRIFGDNKTWRGFAIMVPAVGAAFWTVSHARAFLPPKWNAGLWSLSTIEYCLLGCWAGFAFMAGELPNSFLKRQLGIAPGAAPAHRIAKSVCFVLDRVDSIAGLLLAMSMIVPTPLLTCVFVLLIGAPIHGLFSALLFLFGVKARPA